MTEQATWSSGFPATVKGAIAAASWLDEVARAAQFPEDLSYRVQLCVEELFTNVVRHGGGWAEEAAGAVAPLTVDIIVSRTGDELSVVLKDNGPPFDVARAPARPAAGDLDGVQPGGLGIKLVKEFSTSLSYDHAEGRNCTALKFLWPNSALSLQ